MPDTLDTSTIIVYAAVIIIVAVVSALISYRIGYNNRKKFAEVQIDSAEKESFKIINAANEKAEERKKQAIVDAKAEILADKKKLEAEITKQRREMENDLKERRTEITRAERRIQQKDETIDKKTTKIEKLEESWTAKHKSFDEKLAEIERIRQAQRDILERVSELTQEQAKAELLSTLDSELYREKALRVNSYEQQVKDECDQKARDHISLAISRLASETVAEKSVSVVAIPNDEMKGRIIGREGRNIRALEQLTGVDFIIDDTPEAITVSCHDRVRREIARISLERLLQDGRIHPARIEETVERASREIEQKIKQEGERAILEANVNGLNNELVKLLGRLHFRTSYTQNVLVHSLEVAHLAGLMASELGLDPTIPRRAGLLHDIGKGMSHEIEGTHVEIGVNACRKYKESAEVIHAIEAHHGDIQARTVTAVLVQAADAISAGRPGARNENYENYIKRLQKLENLCKGYDEVASSYAIQAGREVRIMIKPDKANDDRMTVLAREISERIEKEMEYPGQVKINLIRESRVISYAK